MIVLIVAPLQVRKCRDMARRYRPEAELDSPDSAAKTRARTAISVGQLYPVSSTSSGTRITTAKIKACVANVERSRILARQPSEVLIAFFCRRIRKWARVCAFLPAGIP